VQKEVARDVGTREGRGPTPGEQVGSGSLNLIPTWRSRRQAPCPRGVGPFVQGRTRRIWRRDELTFGGGERLTQEIDLESSRFKYLEGGPEGPGIKPPYQRVVLPLLDTRTLRTKKDYYTYQSTSLCTHIVSGYYLTHSTHC